MTVVRSSALAVDDFTSAHVKVEIPARGFGDPPKRTATVEIAPPAGGQFDLEAGQIVAEFRDVNFGGLKETSRTVALSNGRVVIQWALENQDRFPITGRIATCSVFVRVKYESEPPALDSDLLSDRYFNLRGRFFEDFYFQGRIAEWIEPDEKRIKFADQTIYLGQALMVFSAEMQLIRDGELRGVQLEDSRKVVAELLSTIDELELAANHRFDLDAPETPHGLFVRDDISGPTDPRLSNRYRFVDSDWQAPEKENASPSGDQIFGLMFGLLAVKEFSGDTELQQHASEIAARLFDYAKRCNFKLKLPNGKPTRRGSDVWWLASLLHSVQYRITGSDHFESCTVEPVAGVKMALSTVAKIWKNDDTARLIAENAGRKVSFGLAQGSAPFELKLNGFALHILLMATACDTVWSQELHQAAALAANHHLAILYSSLLQGRPLSEGTRMELLRILATVPKEGPSGGAASSSGWSKDNRWVRCTNIYAARTSTHQFNGLDAMVLYCLTRLEADR